MKTCSKCKIEKEKIDFGKEKRGKDGLTTICLKCTSEKKKAFYDANPEKRKEYRDRFKKNNPDKLKIYQKTKNEKIKNNEDLLIKKRKYHLQRYYDNFIIKERKKRAINFSKEYVKRKYALKKQIGSTPSPELIEISILINKTKRLCKTLSN